MAKICYNCGVLLTNEDATVEHIPAKNLYEEYPSEYKKDRITVPACFDCNQLYSKIDAELRDLIAVKNESDTERIAITSKGVRSIMGRTNWKDRIFMNEEGQVIAVNFSYDDLRTFHIKNFKALFFRKYGFVLPEEFEIKVITEGDDDKIDLATSMYHYLVDNKPYEISGHEDIFKFIISDATRREGGNDLYESGDFSQLLLIAGLMVYHQEIIAIIIACKKGYLEEIKTKKATM